MANKTCGECRFLESKEFICCHSGDEVAAHFIACSDFEPIPKPKPTNGDRIRRMSNEELATWGMYDLGTCPTFEKQQSCPKCGECSASAVEDCWREWLNAPADCVKQNGKSAKQADLCCKSAKESEVNNG